MPPTILFGAGGIGKGAITHTWTSASDTSLLLDTLLELGLTQLDSAAGYPPGAPWETERLLGETKAAERGFVIDSKILAGGGGSLTEEKIFASVAKTLELLGVKQVDTLYVHAPEGETPVEETALAFDKQFRLGTFKQLGLCNYTTEQMAEYLSVCSAKGYIKPSVYQGHYNAIWRHPENTLFPLLRQNNIKIIAYGPLAGGFLTGKASGLAPGADLKGGRWEAGNLPIYLHHFDKPTLHAATRAFVQKCEEKGITPTEVSLRWLVHHSALKEADGLILGATKVAQLKASVEYCHKGRLEDGLVQMCEELWRAAKDDIPEGMM